MKKVLLVACCLVIGLAMALVLAKTARAGDECPLGREIAKKSMELFEKDQAKGLAGLIKAQETCPTDPYVLYNLGTSYHRYQRPDLARQTWEKLAKITPDDPVLLANLAWVCLDLGDPDAAKAWGDKALSAKADKARILPLFCELLFRKGQYEEALDLCQQNPGTLSSEYRDKAVKYTVEGAWNVFRSGRREEGARMVMGMARKNPSVPEFGQAKDKMTNIIIGDASDIPLPVPLPTNTGGGSTLAPAAASEVLDIASLPHTDKLRDDSYALVVGIREYRNITGPRFADNDARQVQRLLTRLCGFPNDTNHIRLLLNRDATVGTLSNDLKWLIRKGNLNPEGRIFFYFSGHGSPVLGQDGTTIEEGLLLPYEASLDNLTDRTALSLSYLREQFAGLDNEYALAVIDACFSGSGKSASNYKLIKPVVNPGLMQSDKLFLSAAAADRTAGEYDPGQQGAYSYFFLKALMGKGDKDQDGWVDTIEAHDYASSMLGRMGLEQSPQMSRPARLRLSKVPK
ncbi:MAG: caspase family protein [Pseudomonadota bacterium]